MKDKDRIKIMLFDGEDEHITAWVHNELPYWLAEWLMKLPNLNTNYRYVIRIYKEGKASADVKLEAGLPIPVVVHRVLTEMGY